MKSNRINTFKHSTLFYQEILCPLIYDLRKSPLVAGFKIAIAGRLTRKERAAYMLRNKGILTFARKTLHIDYTADHKIMRFGLVGIKTWVNLRKNKPNFYSMEYISMKKGGEHTVKVVENAAASQAIRNASSGSSSGGSSPVTPPITPPITPPNSPRSEQISKNPTLNSRETFNNSKITPPQPIDYAKPHKEAIKNSTSSHSSFGSSSSSSGSSSGSGSSSKTVWEEVTQPPEGVKITPNRESLLEIAKEPLNAFFSAILPYANKNTLDTLDKKLASISSKKEAKFQKGVFATPIEETASIKIVQKLLYFYVFAENPTLAPYAKDLFNELFFFGENQREFIELFSHFYTNDPEFVRVIDSFSSTLYDNLKNKQFISPEIHEKLHVKVKEKIALNIWDRKIDLNAVNSYFENVTLAEFFHNFPEIILYVYKNEHKMPAEILDMLHVKRRGGQSCPDASKATYITNEIYPIDIKRILSLKAFFKSNYSQQETQFLLTLPDTTIEHESLFLLKEKLKTQRDYLLKQSSLNIDQIERRNLIVRDINQILISENTTTFVIVGIEHRVSEFLFLEDSAELLPIIYPFATKPLIESSLPKQLEFKNCETNTDFLTVASTITKYVVIPLQNGLSNVAFKPCRQLWSVLREAAKTTDVTPNV